MVPRLPFREFAFTCLLVLSSFANPRCCSKPAVRREWSAISETERIEWINAVKCLSKLPHDDSLSPSVNPKVSLIPAVNSSSSYYDDLVYVHMDLNVMIHFTGQFLPWHRAYVYAFESALKNKCGFTGAQPYWDWSRHAGDFSNSPIFDPSPTSGFGGNGDPNNDYRVADGAFSDDFLLAYPAPHKVRRNIRAQPWQGLPSLFADGISDPAIDLNKFANTTFDEAEVSKLVNGFEGNFKAFQTYFEQPQGAHSGIHLTLGGDMTGVCPANAASNCIPGQTWTPNDPLFFMHHAMIDKIWYDWQHANKANFWSYEGGSVQPLQSYKSYDEYPNGKPPLLNLNSSIPSDGMFKEYSILDMMDTTSDTLCYVYE